MMMGKKEKQSALLSLMLAYGLWSTAEQWNRLIQPFMYWMITPHVTQYDALLLTALGNVFVLLGTFITAHFIDTVGCKMTAVVAVVVTGAYHLLVSQLESYGSFMMTQSMMIASQFPMISESFIANIVGVDGDERERTRLFMKLTIPLGISLVFGPWLAVKVLFFTGGSFDLRVSQGACGAFLIVSTLPVVYFLLPDPSPTDRKRALSAPSLRGYLDLLSNPSMLCTLLLAFFIAAPYHAYDQTTRVRLAMHLTENAWDMAFLFILLGASTLVTNMFLIGYLQRRFNSQRLMQIALAILIVSYLYLSLIVNFQEHYYLLLTGMPIQIVGFCIALSELAAQVFGAAPKDHLGKAAGLNRAIQLFAAALTPLLTGGPLDALGLRENNMLCYLCAGMSAIALVFVHFFGSYMNTYARRLPMGFGQDDDVNVYKNYRE